MGEADRQPLVGGNGFGSYLLSSKGEFCGVEAQLPGLLDELVEDGCVEFWCTAENPEVPEVRCSDERPAVVGVEGKDPVVAFEGPEEGDLELRVFLAYRLGGTG